jgi:hypothetical protein
MRIALEIQRTSDLRAQSAGKRLFIYRLWGRVRFLRDSGWSEDHLALIDTGAPYSVIPASLWPAMQSRTILDAPLRGIVPGKTAELRAVLSHVSARLLDERNASPTLCLSAMLVRTEPVPLILGWAGLLDRSRLVIDSKKRASWLEF